MHASLWGPLDIDGDAPNDTNKRLPGKSIVPVTTHNCQFAGCAGCGAVPLAASDANVQARLQVEKVVGPLRVVDVLLVTPGGQKVAVEADGPMHFITDLAYTGTGAAAPEHCAPNGATRLRDWELRRRGLAVVNVPIWWVTWRQSSYELRGRYGGGQELRRRIQGAVAEALQWRPAVGAVRGQGRLGLERVRSPILLPDAGGDRAAGGAPRGQGGEATAAADVEAAWAGAPPPQSGSRGGGGDGVAHWPAAGTAREGERRAAAGAV